MTATASNRTKANFFILHQERQQQMRQQGGVSAKSKPHVSRRFETRNFFGSLSDRALQEDRDLRMRASIRFFANFFSAAVGKAKRNCLLVPLIQPFYSRKFGLA